MNSIKFRVYFVALIVACFSFNYLSAQVSDQRKIISAKDSSVQAKRRDFFKRGFEEQRKMDLQYKDAEIRKKKTLDSIYHLVLTEYRKDTLFIRKLQMSQELWEKLMDANIEAIFPRTGDEFYYGQVLPMCISILREKFIQRRIIFLKTWLEGIPEGESCSGSVKINRGEYMGNKDSTYDPFFSD